MGTNNARDMEVETEMEMEMKMEIEMEMEMKKCYITEVEQLRDPQYLQSERLSGHEVDDWADLPELPLPQSGAFQTTTNIYRSSFTILRHNWGCTPSTCLPESLRLQTPYSLALVVRLAELALLSRGSLDVAHAKLRALAGERSMQFNTQPGRFSTTELARGMAHKRYTEFKVRECLDGITIADVEEAKVHFSVSPPTSNPTAQAASRADRAAKRKMRSRSGALGLESGSKQQDSHPEEHVGGWDRKLQQQFKQVQRNPAKGSRKELKRQAREAILVTRILSGDILVAEDGHMHEAGDGDQAMDSTYVPPNNSPQQEASVDQTFKAPRETPWSDKNRAQIVDRYMARIFDGISVEQDGTKQPGQTLREAARLDLSAPRNDSQPALPFERSAITSSPPLFELQSGVARNDGQPLLASVFGPARLLCEDEEL